MKREIKFNPAFGAPYGSPTGRLSRSHPEIQDLPGAKEKRQRAILKAWEAMYGHR